MKVRIDPDGIFWWLNHPEKGWSSFGYGYSSFEALQRDWRVSPKSDASGFVGVHRDAISEYIEVENG